MVVIKKYRVIILLVIVTITSFIIANQVRVANGGEFAGGVMYFRYLAYLSIALLFFFIGVKTKLILVHNLAMIAVIFIALELVFYALLGSPTRERNKFEMPELASDDIQQLIGYVPFPDTIINEVFVVDGDTSFNVNYTIDHTRKRVTPKVSDNNDEYALFFGCSIAYGYGLDDNETIPYYYQSNGAITAYNFAYNGHGTNHVLARLIHGNLPEQVNETSGKAFYLFFWDHIARAIGTMRRHTSWLHFAPYYYMDGDTLRRNKMFKDGRPFTSFMYEKLYQNSLLEYFEIDFPLSFKNAHFELVAEMVKQSKKHYEAQFGNDEFYMVIMPKYDDSNEKELQNFLRIVEDKGIKVLNFSKEIKYSSKYTLKHDPHPNATFTKLFSELLYTKIK